MIQHLQENSRKGAVVSETGMSGAVSHARRPGGRTAQVTERLWSAALELLAEKGVDGLQYEELSSRARVGRATVYRRWPNRDDLVRDVLERFAETSVPIRDTGEIVDDLTEFVFSFANAAVSPVGRAVLQILLKPAGDADQLNRIRREILARRTEELQRRLDEAARSEQLPAVDAHFVNMMLSGPVQWSILREDGSFSKERAREIAELVVAGLWRQPREYDPKTS